MTIARRRGLFIGMASALLVVGVGLVWLAGAEKQQRDGAASGQSGFAAFADESEGESEAELAGPQAEEKQALVASAPSSSKPAPHQAVKSPVAPVAGAAPPPTQQAAEAPRRELSEEAAKPALNDESPEREDGSGGRNGPPPIPKEVIVETIEAIKPAAQECYDSLLDDFPDASGTVRLKFVFETEGDMSRVQMSEIDDETTLFDQGLHDCLSQAVSTIELPRPPHDNRMTVIYPFKFRPDN